ncbi:16S rRNA (guanine(527)-N(7))-methyltransferase RsmG [Paragemmobacter straminiformis]|uniref:Ribosomal RNA small subunit methyltransferase G n=1 Tax=Paragemmobacter straminiformis TaxID=2045119 RepID=A0A842I9E8_9RHOB|nr:16S rRNA (guanine(527)-N(7))-methyltransferase RsmG [Gemmobacter straminiformis]MBC2836043.1 16S rRNA (guanine(527)-N(7))-methyltransferase RsmG [Gemmobacter straminiformis]
MTELLAGLDVSRETIEKLKSLESLLAKWNPAINLVARSTVDAAWSRHILDSAQLFQIAPFRVWADLGSGGGFPGLVIAVLAEGRGSDARVVLVEADQRKATFLREAARGLGVRVQVEAQRIESVDPLAADILSARALAPLSALCGFAARHLAPAGTAIFPKGQNWEAEVAEARKSWKFDLDVRPSLVEAGSVVLVMKAIVHV